MSKKKLLSAKAGGWTALTKLSGTSSFFSIRVSKRDTVWEARLWKGGFQMKKSHNIYCFYLDEVNYWR